METSTDDIVRIAGIPLNVLRNLQITACYYDLSLSMAQRTGKTTNWCTFATWASRQAGQTIRSEDLRAKLLRDLHLNPAAGAMITLIGAMAKENGVFTTIDVIRETAIAHLAEHASIRASEAVARGNKKVFEEIGYHFARFLNTCANDNVYTQSTLDSFLDQLHDGDPPDGQQFLKEAFTNYYQALFESDLKKKAELNFFANVQIGFHEQTRLQPEIAAALNAGAIDPQPLLLKLNGLLFPPGNTTGGWRRLINWAAGRSGLLEKHVQALTDLTGRITRKMITAQLMTLTFPPGKVTLLGSDVTGRFPASLEHLQDPRLLQMLTLIDPTKDSVTGSGAIDWSELKDRLHFIVDLFRTRHEETSLFEPAFTAEQLSEIRGGNVPSYFNW